MLQEEIKTMRALIYSLLDGWERSLHNVDSLLQVVMADPDWQAKFYAARDNQLRKHETEETFSVIRLAVQELLSGNRDIEDVLREIKSTRWVQ